MRVKYFAICHSEQRRISGSVMQTIYEKWLNSAQRPRIGRVCQGPLANRRNTSSDHSDPPVANTPEPWQARHSCCHRHRRPVTDGWLLCKEVSIPCWKTLTSKLENSSLILKGRYETRDLLHHRGESYPGGRRCSKQKQSPTAFNDALSAHLLDMNLLLCNECFVFVKTKQNKSLALKKKKEVVSNAYALDQQSWTTHTSGICRPSEHLLTHQWQGAWVEEIMLSELKLIFYSARVT